MSATNDADIALNLCADVLAAAQKLLELMPKFERAVSQAQASLASERAGHEQVKTQITIDQTEAAATKLQLRAQVARVQAAAASFQ
jgi:hypothetical protein